jgi:hypothetical protein
MFGRFSRACSVLLLSSVVALSGCGGSGKGANAANPTAQAAARLDGQWQLVSFAPSLQLEEPLQGLLDAQLKALSIAFSNGQFTAAGPGVDTSGRYEITSVTGDSLAGRVYDRAGAGYGITGTFVGTQFQFTSTDSPWTGKGVLERVK